MWSKKSFLRVRVRFVECRDALMQILASLDRDKKNSCVSVASVLVLRWEESEKWLMVGLCFVTKITNRACEWGETYSRTCFIFFILMTNWTCQRKRQTDSTKWALKIFLLQFLYIWAPVPNCVPLKSSFGNFKDTCSIEADQTYLDSVTDY